MKRQTYLILGFLGISALISLPAIAQENRIEDFFGGTPPYNGEDVTAPLNPVEDTQDSALTETQQFDSATPPTTDNPSDGTRIYLDQGRNRSDSSYENRQPSGATTPMTRDNLMHRNGN